MKDNGQAEGTLFSMDKELMKVMTESITGNTTAIEAGKAEIGKLVEGVDALKGIDGRVGAVEAEVGSLREKIESLLGRPYVPEDLVRQLLCDLRKHTEFFEKPVRKEIHHRHFLGWPIVVIFILTAVTCSLGAWCVSIKEGAEEYRANDIKWRYARLIRDTALFHKVEAVDHKYQEDPEGFRRDVIEGEENWQALTERLMERNEKDEQIDQLKKQQKRF